MFIVCSCSSLSYLFFLQSRVKCLSTTASFFLSLSLSVDMIERLFFLQKKKKKDSCLVVVVDDCMRERRTATDTDRHGTDARWADISLHRQFTGGKVNRCFDSSDCQTLAREFVCARFFHYQLHALSAKSIFVFSLNIDLISYSTLSSNHVNNLRAKPTN